MITQKKELVPYRTGFTTKNRDSYKGRCKSMGAQVAVRNGIIKFNFSDSVMVLVHEGLQAELLEMFSRYPHAEFTSRIIADNLKNAGLPDIEEALESLVKTNLVEKRTRRELSFYSLTTNP